MEERIWTPNRRHLFRTGGALLAGAGAVALLSACGGSGSGGGSGATTGGTGAPASGGAKLGVNGMAITIGQAKAAPTMTGVVDKTWKGVPAVNLDPSDPGVSTNGATAQNPAFTSKVYLQWDSKNLYVLEDRTQAPPFQASGGDGQYYLGDTLMMFFDTDKDATGSNYIDGDYAFFITPFNGTTAAPRAWDREGHSSGGANEHQVSDIKFGYKASAKGYGFAITMPWSEIQVTAPWKVQKGASMGFCVGGASQTADGGWGQMQFNGKADDQSTWGTLVLA